MNQFSSFILVDHVDIDFYNVYNVDIYVYNVDIVDVNIVDIYSETNTRPIPMFRDIDMSTIRVSIPTTTTAVGSGSNPC
jgi:hypothetical protein